jgi:hypothetical protein
MGQGSEEKEPEPERTLAAIIAYLSLLDRDWKRLSEEERRSGVRLALEAARRTHNV